MKKLRITFEMRREGSFDWHEASFDVNFRTMLPKTSNSNSTRAAMSRVPTTTDEARSRLPS